ncbi:MAG: hypothetical protein NVS3B3_21570 [Aquirhabdus sp.]
MSEDDFMTEEEICAFMGWTPGTLANRRSLDKRFPLKCPGKIRRYPRKEFMFWYNDRAVRMAKRRAS